MDNAQEALKPVSCTESVLDVVIIVLIIPLTIDSKMPSLQDISFDYPAGPVVKILNFHSMGQGLGN